MPWRPSPERVGHHQLVTNHLKEFGFPIFEADAGGDIFSSARSYNKAAAEAGDWDVAILHEADVWVDHSSLHAALEFRSAFVYAYDEVITLTEEASAQFHRGQREFGPVDYTRRIQYRKLTPGGPRVVARWLWDRTGGFDERFVGWGGEDNAFRFACGKHAGPAQRVPGVLFQLWHPRNPDDPYFARWPKNRKLYADIKRGYA